MGWGEDEVWYGIRHTFATRLCELKTNLVVVQELMGHKNINQTAQYAKATDDAKANAIKELSAMTGQREEGSLSFQMFPNNEQKAVQSAVQSFAEVRVG